jgi:hypothetical protein
VHYTLVYSSSAFGVGWRANEGFDYDDVFARLHGLSLHGHTYEVVDGDGLTDEERDAFYVRAESTRKPIRTVFHNPSGGVLAFGLEVPALLVSTEREAELPDDVYPQGEPSALKTIAWYLASLE